MERMPIIDSHCHIFPELIAERASASIAGFYDDPVCCDGSLKTLLSLGEAAGITRHVVSSSATNPHQVSHINRFISDSVRLYPDRLTGLGSLHPDSPDIQTDVDQILSLGLAGVKVHPDFQTVAVDDPRFFRLFECCQGKLPVLCHCGDSRFRYSNPVQIKRVLKNFPDLTLIAAHFGGWTVWRDAVAQLYDSERIRIDCSSSLFTLGRAEATAFIRFFGAERVLFGVDYPMWIPADEVARFRALCLTEEEQDLILWKNASEVFQIPV